LDCRVRPPILVRSSLCSVLEAGVVRVVRVEGGLLRGSEFGGVCAFLDVPYAAAPIGADRFLAAAPNCGARLTATHLAESSFSA
jgi:hypothetical protein